MRKHLFPPQDTHRLAADSYANKQNNFFSTTAEHQRISSFIVHDLHFKDEWEFSRREIKGNNN